VDEHVVMVDTGFPEAFPEGFCHRKEYTTK